MTESRFETLRLEVVLGQEFRAWADEDLMGDLDWFMHRHSSLLPCATATLRGHLSYAYDIVDDASVLRLLDRVKRHREYATIQRQAADVWQNAHGLIHASVIDFVRGAFHDSMVQMSEDMKWEFVDKEFNEDFVRAVSEYHTMDGDAPAWVHAASHTPCLCVHDGPTADPVSKSYINMFDLFQVVACDGQGVLVLRQKNFHSYSVVAPVVSEESRTYIFEAAAWFESGRDFAFMYFTNGIACDIGRCVVKVVDRQRRIYEAKVNVALVAIACRFRVPYTFVSAFWQSQNNSLTIECCGVDSRSHSVWNVMLRQGQNGNHKFTPGTVQSARHVDDFVFTKLGDMEEECAIRNAIQLAKMNGKIYRLCCPHGPKTVLHDDCKYRELVYVGSGTTSVWYCDTDDGDTVLLQTADISKDFLDDTLLCISTREYSERLFDVVAHHQHSIETKIHHEGQIFGVSISIAMSNAVNHGHELGEVLEKNGSRFVLERTEKNELVSVQHLNGKPRCHCSNNLAIITCPEEPATPAGNSTTGVPTYALVINSKGEMTWTKKRPPTARRVTSIAQAMGNLSQAPFLLNISRFLAPPKPEKIYEFVLIDSTRIERRVHFSLKQLLAECRRLNLEIKGIRQLQSLVSGSKKAITAMSFGDSIPTNGLRIKYYSPTSECLKSVDFFVKK